LLVAWLRNGLAFSVARPTRFLILFTRLIVYTTPFSSRKLSWHSARGAGSDRQSGLLCRSIGEDARVWMIVGPALLTHRNYLIGRNPKMKITSCFQDVRGPCARVCPEPSACRDSGNPSGGE